VHKIPIHNFAAVFSTGKEWPTLVAKVLLCERTAA
jgi:hypothetical protein